MKPKFHVIKQLATLQGGVTENENTLKGQLQAGMEKVVGDLAFTFLQDANVPTKRPKYRNFCVTP